MPKSAIHKAKGYPDSLVHGCPKCGHCHFVPAERWNWNKDLDKPTLSPSVRHYYDHPKTGVRVTTCHYHIKNGQIEYCSDSPNPNGPQTVDLPELRIEKDELGQNIYVMD